MAELNALYIYIYNYYIYIYIWDSFHENGPSYIIIKSYKIALHLNRNNFRTIKAINFLFSTLHTTPFLYGKIHLGSCTCSVPELQRSIPTWFKLNITFCKSYEIASNLVCRWRGPIPIDLFCSLIFMPSVTACTFSRLIRANVIIPASPYIERNAICPNHWRESSAKMGT